MSYYKEGPVIDPAPVLEKAIAIAEIATELSPFEAKFLKDTISACSRFKDTFRFSPQQHALLQRIYVEKCLPAKIDAKVRAKPEDK